jgi:transketolase C-terminal domain/subunit
MHLVDLGTAKIELVPTRDGFGKGLIEAGRTNPNVIGICADLSESTRMEGFKTAFPQRYIEIGVAEQMLAAMASGLAAAGKIPFIASYAMFDPGRSWEQVRTTMALNETNVKIAGAHAGVSVGPDGATHQAIEDIAIMRVIPKMTVVVPCDAVETHKATIAVAERWGPTYLRFGRLRSARRRRFELATTSRSWRAEYSSTTRCKPRVNWPSTMASSVASSTITRSSRWMNKRSSPQPASAEPS